MPRMAGRVRPETLSSWVTTFDLAKDMLAPELTLRRHTQAMQRGVWPGRVQDGTFDFRAAEIDSPEIHREEEKRLNWVKRITPRRAWASGRRGTAY